MAFDERVTLIWALALGVGCGRSIRHDSRADSASDGGGGERNAGTRLYFESAGSLLVGDFDGEGLLELCPGADEPAAYTLVGTDGDWTIVLRERCSTSGETSILRVAPDGSECSTVYSRQCSRTFGGSTLQGLSPVVDGRVVLSLLAPSPEAMPEGGALASIRTDGSGYEVIASEGVNSPQVVGGRVLFYYYQRTGEDALALYTARADGTDKKPLFPSTGYQSYIAAGPRLIVDVDHDVVAIDPDGERLVELAVGPGWDSAHGLAGNQVVISRTGELDEPGTQADLYAVPIDGGELVPLATSPENETFAGASGDRIVYYTPYIDVSSVKLDGSDPQPIARTTDAEGVSDIEGDRVLLIRALGMEPIRYALVSAAIDGSDAVTLADSIGGSPALVGDRAIASIGGSHDLMSFSATGGDPVVLAAGAGEGAFVGRIGRTLLLQTTTNGEIARTEADGSDRRALLPSGSYVGAITERCGIVPTNFRLFPCIDP